MIVKLRMTGHQHRLLKTHLFPADGNEAVAFAICGRRSGDEVHALCVRELHMVPHERCRDRSRNRVTWSTDEVRRFSIWPVKPAWRLSNSTAIPQDTQDSRIWMTGRTPNCLAQRKNLNRIINARLEDAIAHRPKVDVAADFIREIGFSTEVESLSRNLCEAEAVKRVAECDFVFGCMDGSEGRFLLNKLAAFYCLPYIDVGVRLEADGDGGIDQICGTVHYLQPDGSSSLSRGAITMDAIQSEGLKRTNPRAYAGQLQEKYISGVREDRPAVMPVNMHYASLAVLELLARVHSYRVEGNVPFAQFGSSLTDPRFEPVKPDGDPCGVLARHVGRGDVIPLLDNPYLDEGRAA